jgi:hypothetical protein
MVGEGQSPSLQQAAGEFGLNPVTLFRYLKRGKLTRFRREMDNRTYIDRPGLVSVPRYRTIMNDRVVAGA